MSKPPFTVRALGEVAIRVADMGAMVRFYRDRIGLTLLRGGEDAPITFFRIAGGFGGHTTVLALFDRALQEDAAGGPVTGAQSSLHHIALSLPFAEQEAVMRWYEETGQPYRVEHFDWVGWRGIFTEDPEGNVVELVAYDDTLLVE
ncbi:VOC family protein [Pelagovum pacificum]|uniref:VOC family protein n=1 Tax=Pelagovum pacificum TaxID=2588711 RepID=A0A5C5GH60_9RHOB|nr:VOC family protein [Pelagovum pacificum]QQA42937.1 VOC family protein [Pelagovum pacificum]TNY33920.1 VOC family protein [Pelagovum pacificum]